ncbi:MAG: carbohydrate binding family 9 domain-containing protein [Acidobacteriota bacterium]|nr:carbohydrate binding family 9 domain-containing protein [Acidobacteriota bacterium]
MVKKPVAFFLLLLTSLLLAITPVVSQSSHANRSLRALFSDAPPTLDGLLDESLWLTAPQAEPLTQKEPTEGDRASESTEIRVVYTKTSLFLAIVCADSAADDPIATELRRDGDLSKDDSIWILIDSFHDHRNAFLFATNPLGTQYDALIIDEGNEVNVEWDEVWKVASHQDEQGWTVEIEIPFKALRMNAQGGEVGLEFRRIIRRKNEFVFWNSWNRDFKFEEVSQAGHLTGLEVLELGSRWRLKPYALGGLGKRGGGGWENRSEVGIDDFKWRLTSTLTADLTYNTDFAEVELDAQRVNFSNPRSQLFFPEKREFFFEGATFFDFSARMNEFAGESFRAFFSRRIGLTSDGQRIPVLGGGKLTGRAGPFSIGALNVETEEENDIGSNNFSVLRMRYDLFSRSTIGGIVTNRSGNGSFNRTAGLDTRVVLFENFIFDGFWMRSVTPGLEENQDAYHAKGYWRTDLLDIGLGHLTLEENFNAEMGFAQRAHTRKSIWDVAYKPRPGISWLRQLSIRAFAEYFTTPDNVVEKKITHYNLDFIFESGDTLRLSPHDRFDRLFRPVQLAPGVVVPPGDYRGQSYLVQFRLDPSRPLGGRIQFSPQRGFFGGSKITFGVFPQWKPVPSLILDLGYDLNKIDVPQGKFTSHLVNATLNYALSTEFITTATFQYNNKAQVKTFNFRFNYIYRPGDDIFFVFREIQSQLDPTLNDRAILLKFTRSFDF